MTFFEKCAKMGNLYYFPSFWATDNLDLMKWTNLREGFIIFSKTVKVTPVSKVTPNNGTHVFAHFIYNACLEFHLILS